MGPTSCEHLGIYSRVAAASCMSRSVSADAAGRAGRSGSSFSDSSVTAANRSIDDGHSRRVGLHSVQSHHARPPTQMTRSGSSIIDIAVRAPPMGLAHSVEDSSMDLQHAIAIQDQLAAEGSNMQDLLAVTIRYLPLLQPAHVCFIAARASELHAEWRSSQQGAPQGPANVALCSHDTMRQCASELLQLLEPKLLLDALRHAALPLLGRALVAFEGLQAAFSSPQLLASRWVLLRHAVDILETRTPVPPSALQLRGAANAISALHSLAAHCCVGRPADEILSLFHSLHRQALQHSAAWTAPLLLAVTRRLASSQAIARRHWAEAHQVTGVQHDALDSQQAALPSHRVWPDSQLAEARSTASDAPAMTSGASLASVSADVHEHAAERPMESGSTPGGASAAAAAGGWDSAFSELWAPLWAEWRRRLDASAPHEAGSAVWPYRALQPSRPVWTMANIRALLRSAGQVRVRDELFIRRIMGLLQQELGTCRTRLSNSGPSSGAAAVAADSRPPAVSADLAHVIPACFSLLCLISMQPPVQGEGQQPSLPAEALAIVLGSLDFMPRCLPSLGSPGDFLLAAGLVNLLDEQLLAGNVKTRERTRLDAVWIEFLEQLPSRARAFGCGAVVQACEFLQLHQQHNEALAAAALPCTPRARSQQRRALEALCDRTVHMIRPGGRPETVWDSTVMSHWQLRKVAEALVSLEHPDLRILDVLVAQVTGSERVSPQLAAAVARASAQAAGPGHVLRPEAASLVVAHLPQMQLPQLLDVVHAVALSPGAHSVARALEQRAQRLPEDQQCLLFDFLISTLQASQKTGLGSAAPDYPDNRMPLSPLIPLALQLVSSLQHLRLLLRHFAELSDLQLIVTALQRSRHIMHHINESGPSQPGVSRVSQDLADTLSVALCSSSISGMSLHDVCGAVLGLAALAPDQRQNKDASGGGRGSKAATLQPARPHGKLVQPARRLLATELSKLERRHEVSQLQLQQLVELAAALRWSGVVDAAVWDHLCRAAAWQVGAQAAASSSQDVRQSGALLRAAESGALLCDLERLHGGSLGKVLLGSTQAHPAVTTSWLVGMLSGALTASAQDPLTLLRLCGVVASLSTILHSSHVIQLSSAMVQAGCHANIVSHVLKSHLGKAPRPVHVQHLQALHQSLSSRSWTAQDLQLSGIGRVSLKAAAHR